jgi:hypothetical protein
MGQLGKIHTNYVRTKIFATDPHTDTPPGPKRSPCIPTDPRSQC